MEPSITIKIRKLTPGRFELLIFSKGKRISERIVTTNRPYELAERLTTILKVDNYCNQIIK